jgi:hypothetical protein
VGGFNQVKTPRHAIHHVVTPIHADGLFRDLNLNETSAWIFRSISTMTSLVASAIGGLQTIGYL